MSWSEGGRLRSARKISEGIVAVPLLNKGANTGTGTSLIKNSTSSLGLKSPGNKVVLSCVRFSYHDADDAETVVDIQKSVVYRFNYNETCG